MASDFYARTKSLFEEFQKRELNYLNTEQIINSRIKMTNETSLPIQDYLHKLNKREKETDETYKGLLSHLEKLDQHAEKIYDNVEKLTALRTSMISNNSSWSPAPPSDSCDKSFLSYNYPSKHAQAVQDFKYTLSNPTELFSSQNQDLKIVSTQTDQIFCENCHTPYTLSSQILKELPSIPSSFSVTNTKILTSPSIEDTLSSKFHNQSDNVALQNVSAISTNDIKNRLFLAENIPLNQSDTLKQRDNRRLQNSSFLPEENIGGLENTQSAGINITMNQVYVDTVSEKVIPNQQEHKNTFGPKSSFVILDTEENAETNREQEKTDNPTFISKNLDKITSKSDESLNHEFDFLESDRKHMKSCAEESSQLIENDNNTDPKSIHELDDSNTHKEKKVMPSPSSVQNLEIPQSIKKSSDSSHNVIDKISESSVSFGGEGSPSIRSDNISAVSDSDSFNEKEEPFNASAAYQALLGNVSLSKTPQKPTFSESDSEDEVEKALANATRKSSTVPLSAKIEEKAHDNQRNVPEVKPNAEPRKSISLGKPQQLSKSTRKVLGLDTSSGSEGELQIQAKPQAKIEEDSDEFDFYN